MSDNITVMAFDFGASRIGIAIGNTLLKIPHPIGVVVGKNKYDKLDQIAKLVDKWRPKLLIVGMPSKLDEESYNRYSTDVLEKILQQKDLIINSINNFRRMLINRFNIPVVFVDESYTSSVARTQLYEQGVRSKEHKGKLDELAACNILSTYFNSVSFFKTAN